MNRKHKKNKQKPPNPGPPVPPQAPEKLQDVTPVEVSPVEVTPVQEVTKVEVTQVQEVSQVPEVAEESKVETPKKPKRNKSGKKAQDDKLPDVQDVVEKVEPNPEVKPDVPQTQDNDTQDSPVAPAARKKKGKNKNKNNENVEEIKPVTEVKPALASEPEITESIQEPVETKSSKKKNKKNKKNRNDSEKSDNIKEEVLTQTQPIVDEKTEEVIQNVVKNEQDKGKTEKGDQIVENIKIEAVDNKVEPTLEDKESKDTSINKELLVPEVFETSSRNKKKNKKKRTDSERSQTELVTEVSKESSKNTPESNILKEIETSTPIQEKCTETKVEEEREKSDIEIRKEEKVIETNVAEMKEVIIALETPPTTIAVEPTAEPVESIQKPEGNSKKKNKKNKKETAIAEFEAKAQKTTIDETKIQIVSTEQAPIFTPKESTLILPIDLPKETQKDVDMGLSEKPEIKPKEECGKPKTETVSIEPVEINPIPDNVGPLTPIIIDTKQVGITDQIKTEPVVATDVLATSSEQPPVTQEIITTETEADATNQDIDQVEDFVPVTQHKKKNKKNKKTPPANIETCDTEIPQTSELKQATSENVAEACKVDDKITKNLIQSCETSSLDAKLPESTTKTADSKVKIEQIDMTTSTDSGSNVPHSVEFPRSLSAGSSAGPYNNNNTRIQEITIKDDKLAVPVLMPENLVKDANETIAKPKEDNKTSSDINKEKQQKFKQPEITELKSKVLEVNQDMEELRLSIEKSLAELTALEKSDDIPELIAITMPDILATPDKPKSDLKEISKESIIPELPLPPVETKPQTTVEPKTQTNVETISQATVETKAQTLEEINVVDAVPQEPPIIPARKDQKGKGKAKKKPKQNDNQQTASTTPPTDTKSDIKSNQDTSNTATQSQTTKNDAKSNEQKSDSKQKDTEVKDDKKDRNTDDFDPIEHFEDAMTSSADDVNKSFELIASELDGPPAETSVTKTEDRLKFEVKDEKPKKQISPSKNYLGPPNIPVPSNKIDYKKEKNKTPNMRHAKVKIKDEPEIENQNKMSKESQTLNKASSNKTFDYNDDDYVYKYSFRKVYLPNACHVCKKILTVDRTPCNFCNLIFYCSQNHKEDDLPNHQSLCFAVSTISQMKEQKFIYEDAKNVTDYNYRLLRMQVIISSEKILKRKLMPWEQEALLYPRMCAEDSCREWRQSRLTDCDLCGQVSFCSPDHVPKSHPKWCQSHSLYQKLVVYQQSKGRLEPKLPTRVISDRNFELPDKINELLATIYEEKIDMDQLQYSALTQLATAPLTAAYCHKIAKNITNGMSKKSFTIHIVDAELQFEADALCKWEVFYLHLAPEVKDLKVVLIGPDLNPSQLPLDLLAKIKLCDHCQENNRRLIFEFEDKKCYHEYCSSENYTIPDLVCAFNTSVHRNMGVKSNSVAASVNSILKTKAPFCITAYTPNDLPKDISRIKSCSQNELQVLLAPTLNPYSSVRPDRNFISDDEMPLLFRNYCFALIKGK